MATTTTDIALESIRHKLQEVASRVRLRGAVRGTGAGACVWLITLGFFGSLALAFQAPVAVRGLLLIVHLAASAAALWWGLGRLDFFRRGDKAWARYCEREHAKLEGRLATVVDVSADALDKRHPVTNLLIDETDRKMKLFRVEQIATHDQVKRYALAASAPFVLGLLAFLANPDGSIAVFRSLYGIPAATDPNYSLEAFNAKKLGLEVRPGNVTLARGTALSIDVTTERQSDTAPSVILDGAAIEGEHTMAAADEAKAFSLLVDHVAEPFHYRVRLGAVESPRYHVEVFDAPAIEAFHTEIEAPEYLKLAAETVEGYYVNAPEGSALTVQLQATAQLESATLVAEDGEDIAGKVSGTRATFHLDVDGDRRFSVIVQDRAAHTNLEPPSFEIVSVADALPSIKLARPGADWEIHPIGEVDLEVEISDDHGVVEAALEYRINGNEPVSITLFDDGQRPTVNAAHTFLLEDMDLKFGDVIAYRVFAYDGRPNREAARAGSQPYFITIRPYEQRFFQGEPGGEGEGTPQPNQREVIVATWRLLDALEAGKRGSIDTDANEVADTQAEVRGNTEKARNQMAGRGDLPDAAERTAHLNQAIEEMFQAEERLRESDLEEALPHENAALAHLMAAFAGLPKGDSQGGGGGGGPPPSLLGQKLEGEQNKYETLDALAQEMDRALAEAINRTKALAQRQKEFAETIRRERQQASSGGGGGGSSSPSESSGNSRPSKDQTPTQEMLNREDMLKALEEAREEVARLQDELLDLPGMQAELTPDLREALKNAADALRRMENEVRNSEWTGAENANAQTTEAYREMVDEMEALRAQLANPENNPQEGPDLQQALERVQEMRAELQAQAAQQAANPNPQPTPGPGAPSESPSMSMNAGSAAMSQRPGAPRDERGGDYDSATAATGQPSPADPAAMQVQLEAIAHLLDERSTALPLVESLQAMVVSEMNAAPDAGASGEVQYAGEFTRLLSQIEEILHWELAASREMQRLQQTPQEDLPPRFRELAARYFEALGALRAHETAP